MTLPTARRLAAGAALAAGFVLLANDGRHHWHEFRYLYSATFYSTAELMQGVFDPGPSPVKTPDQVATWYVTDLLHIYILSQLVALFGVGLRAYTVIKTLYALMLMASGALVLKSFRDLGISPGRSALTASLFVMSPLTVYLGFKLMGEVPSLFFSSCALALFAAALRRSDVRVRAALSGAAGLCVALAALSTARMPLLFLGFWVALVLTSAPTRKQSIVRVGVIAWIVFLAAGLLIFRGLGGRFDIYYHAVTGFFEFSKPLPMWMFATFNVGLFGMALWLAVPLAWLSSDRQYRSFLLVWFGLSGVPVLIGAANFLEPRYLVTALIPFTALGALGIEAFWIRLRDLGWRAPRTAIATVLGAAGIVGTATAQGLMPYEIDTSRLVELVKREAPLPTSTVILVPWNYSDFHFLRFAFPDRSIYLVQSAATEAGQAVDDPEWTSRFAKTYGTSYLANAATVPDELFDRRILYVGWTILPSLQNLREILLSLGLSRVADYTDASRFRNHMVESWVVHDSRFAMQEVTRYGQYRVYEVQYRRPAPPLDPTALSVTPPGAETDSPVILVPFKESRDPKWEEKPT